jgi:hypothetical protein
VCAKETHVRGISSSWRHVASYGRLKIACARRPIVSQRLVVNLNLIVPADGEPTSASRIQRSIESSTMDSHDPNLDDATFGTQDWPDHLRAHAVIYREIAERTDDTFIKNKLLDLASVCEEVADNIEDHQTQTRH